MAELSDSGDIHQTQTASGGGFSRRTLVRSAAWSAPAIVLVTAAPANAAFSSNASLGLGPVGVSLSNFPSPAPLAYRYWSGTAYSSRPAGTAPTAQPNSLMTVTVSGVTASGGGSDPVLLTITITGQDTSGTVRGAAQYGTHNTADWTLATPTLDNASKTATYKFTSTGPVVSGETYPDLVFAVANPSTGNPGTVYTWTTGKTIAVIATAPGASQAASAATSP